MPGIVGLITKRPADQARAELSKMVDTLRHEPSYTIGMCCDESAGLFVGWIARKDSFADRMPLWNERADVGLFFAGEDYPEPGTIESLKAKGHTIEPKPSAYLVHLAEEDTDFPRGLNGRFHGLLVDKRRGRTTLFNDRYGMQRIYWHESADTFYFGAEAKSLLAVCPDLRQADPRGLGEYVACGCVLENRTLFKGVHVLPPSSAWVFDGSISPRKIEYFRGSEWEDQSPLELESYYRQLRETFATILPRYFESHEELGMSLTGGLDSRMILSWQRPEPNSLPCYSFGGIYRDCQDVKLARRVAASCGQSHHVIPVAEEFLNSFAHYAERSIYLTDGCIDVSHSPDLFVNERAAKIAPVRMTGNYGGEVLRRVRAFKPVMPADGLFRPEFVSHVKATKATYANLITGHPLSFAVFRQAPWHHYGLSALEQTQVALRSPYLDNKFVQTVFRAPASALGNNNVSLRLIADGSRKLSQIRTDRGLGGRRIPLLSDIEAAYLEFTFKSEYAYDYGMPQWVAKIDHTLSGLHLERLFLGRHKFYHFRIWYRDSLSRYIEEMLLDSQTLARPYLNKNAVENVVHGHLKGGRNYTSEIHKVLTLELIHRLFL